MHRSALRLTVAAASAFSLLTTGIAVRAQTPKASSSTAVSPRPAADVLAAAVKTAKASNKSILVHFGASW